MFKYNNKKNINENNDNTKIISLPWVTLYNLYHAYCCIGSHTRDGHRGTLVQLLPMCTRGKQLGCWGRGGRRHGHESSSCHQISY